MGRRTQGPPGLRKRGGIWHIHKRIGGATICRSTGTSDLAEAERYLAHIIEEHRRADIYGERPRRCFSHAASRYLNETTKASLRCDANHLRLVMPFIGDLPLEAVHMGSLQQFIKMRQAAGKKARTINYALQVVRRIPNLAASEWIDDKGRTWLAHAPKIKLLPETDKREPYPLSWEEQERLFAELPPHMADMALFKVNTGCREQEVCGLRWEWSVEVPELGTAVFIIPAARVKNRQDRLVVLNRTAESVVRRHVGKHPVFVFTYEGQSIRTMSTKAWRLARERAGLPEVRVHDLKHTFGRRLRAAGVSFEDRQDLLGHKSTRITTHYSRPELENLLTAANSVCGDERSKMQADVMLRKNRAGAPLLKVVNSQ